MLSILRPATSDIKHISTIYDEVFFAVIFNSSNGNTRKRCEIRSTFTMKTLERRQLRCSSVFIANFEYISLLFLIFLLLNLNMHLFAPTDFNLNYSNGASIFREKKVK